MGTRWTGRAVASAAITVLVLACRQIVGNDHLETTAPASASIVMVRLRSKPEKLPRTRRYELRGDRWI